MEHTWKKEEEKKEGVFLIKIIIFQEIKAEEADLVFLVVLKTSIEERQEGFHVTGEILFQGGSQRTDSQQGILQNGGVLTSGRRSKHLQEGLHHAVCEWPHVTLELSNEGLGQATQVCLELRVCKACLDSKELVLQEIQN